MNPQEAIELLRFVEAEDGASLARTAKRLGWSQSQLLRRLAVLGDEAAVGGPAWIEQRDGDPPRLFLTAAGRHHLMHCDR